MRPKLGSLFDGSGGFPLAASMCGIEPTWASEVEPYPIAVTKNQFPRMQHLGDVNRIDGAKIEPVDIITFGSPCQDMSVAGKRAGIKHERMGDGTTTRSGLFIEAVRIIKEMREATDGLYPTFAVWENVPGAFSSNGGEDFRIVLEEIIHIVEPDAVMPPVPQKGWARADCYCGDGWSIAYRTFDAQYWGVPQRRRRIYLVADFGGERAGKILFERESLRGYFEAGRPPWKEAASNAERGTRADDREGETISLDRNARQNGCGFDSDVSFTLNSTDRHGVVFSVQDFGGYKESQITSTLKSRDFKGNADVVISTEERYADKSLTPWDTQSRRVYSENGVFPTLTAKEKAGQNMQAVFSRYVVRRLTPTECARLQGFPDKWGYLEHKGNLTDDEFEFWINVRNTHATINGKAAKEYTKVQMLGWYNKLHTDSAEYKMWGNGIALPTALYVVQGIMTEIQKSKCAAEENNRKTDASGEKEKCRWR